MRAVLVSINPVLASDCQDTYNPAFEKGDMVITRTALEKCLSDVDFDFEALIIRSLPNAPDKLTRNYDETPPPFLTNEAMQFISDLNVSHLLVDMPSIDRLNDDGHLSNHHIYWGVPQGSCDVKEPSSKTITEFIFAADHVNDGPYILSLNIGNIRSDAAPSKPVLYEIL
jgi:hypothetical protein